MTDCRLSRDIFESSGYFTWAFVRGFCAYAIQPDCFLVDLRELFSDLVSGEGGGEEKQKL